MRSNSLQGNVCSCITCVLLIVFSGISFAQQQTTVSGAVKDALTEEALSYANVYFANTTTGTTTDENGNYTLSTTEEVTSIVASYVGYEEKSQRITEGQAQTIDFELRSDAFETETATVIAKKERYSKKNNPAVDFMREVIAHKDSSGVNGKAYTSYEKYEKIQVDLNNIDKRFRESKFFNGLEFIWDYLDSTGRNSKPFLPMLLRETASTVYHKTDPTKEREYITGQKSTKLDANVDQSNLNQVINTLYQDVDIYKNEITLIRKQFISPLAPIAISFYRFYIIDTVDIAGQSTTHLSFIPKNQATYGFTGDIYVVNDGSYQVRKIEMGLFGDVNLNFVRSIHIYQDFKDIDNSYLLTRDKVVMDFSLNETGMGFTGTKSIFRDNYDFKPPQDLKVFKTIDNTIVNPISELQDDSYWTAKRQVPLNRAEAGIFHLVDTLPTVPKFKRIAKISSIVLGGYIPIGKKLDVGPYSSFIGFNNVEGSKPTLPLETTLNFSKKWFLKGYVAYGLDDERFKYAAFATYSFNENHLKNPRHYITVSYADDTVFPGNEQGSESQSNAASAFSWGFQDQLLFSETFRTKYVKETKSLEFGVYYANTQRRPIGNFDFNFINNGNLVNVGSVNTSEIGASIRFAPNQQFTQNRTTRNRIYNKYPIFDLKYAKGFNDFLGGDHDYHSLEASAFKQFGLSILGVTNIEVSAGKIFGEVPYILMNILKANQTYVFESKKYNMIEFIEFVGDEYLTINAQHFFEGFFLNRIPIIKKAKMREIVTFKAAWGSVADRNNPNLNSNLIQFPVDEQDLPTTTVLSSRPYMEASVGVSNILKFFRVDLVQRLSYLDNPNLQSFLGRNGLGIRFQIAVDF